MSQKYGAIMSKINSYYEKQRMVSQLQDELSKLENDQKLKEEMEFKEKLEKLMKDYGKSADKLLEVMRVIEPKIEAKLKKTGSNSSGDGRQGAKRALKRYKNPHTGEVVETRGGNNKQLKECKEKYGDSEVKSWAETVG